MLLLHIVLWYQRLYAGVHWGTHTVNCDHHCVSNCKVYTYVPIRTLLLCDFANKLIHLQCSLGYQCISSPLIIFEKVRVWLSVVLLGSVHRAPEKKLKSVPVCLICSLNLPWGLAPCTTKVRRADTQVGKNTIPSILTWRKANSCGHQRHNLMQPAFLMHN